MRSAGTRRVVAVGALLAATATCIPDLGPGDSLVTSTRVLAVRAVPAEAPPGTAITFTPFVVGPSGAIANADVAWSFCTAPRPLTDDNVVSNACLDAASLAAVGAGPTVTATTPQTACALFGPDTPPGGFRPTDPDVTGGYYQPLRADLPGLAPTFALARIRCNLANADAASASAFAAAYKVNQNPVLLPLAGSIGGAPAATSAIPAGAQVDFRASWGAASAETFAYFDPASQSVTTQREAMTVSWYATAGTFATESTGRASTDVATTSDDTWTAPPRAGSARLFVVLRDSRGGVDFATVELTVVP
jgi:hypothetical protein